MRARRIGAATAALLVGALATGCVAAGPSGYERFDPDALGSIDLGAEQLTLYTTAGDEVPVAYDQGPEQVVALLSAYLGPPELSASPGCVGTRVTVWPGSGLELRMRAPGTPELGPIMVVATVPEHGANVRVVAAGGPGVGDRVRPPAEWSQLTRSEAIIADDGAIAVFAQHDPRVDHGLVAEVAPSGLIEVLRAPSELPPTPC